MLRWIASAVVAVALAAATATAHHSIAGYYDETRQVNLDGVITQFQFVNPHPFLFIDVKDGDRAAQWRLEMDNRGELVAVGMTAETLKPGDRVVVRGSPGRTQPQTAYIRRLDRPVDGFRYEQVGFSPKISQLPRGRAN
jgi:hypothetical protein